MTVTVCPAYPHLKPEDAEGRAAVVIDTLRMTSVAAAALENGCRHLYTVSEVDEARALSERIGALKGGERGAVRIDGFDFGNSPLEYTPEKIAGRDLVMTTSNGTRAILAAKNAVRLYLGCMRNAAVVADLLHPYEKCVLVCAGTGGRFSLEDGLTAGAILSHLPGAETDDLGLAMRSLYEASKEDLMPLLGSAAHVKNLMRLGFGADIDFCMRPDAASAVPVRNGTYFERA